MMIKGEQQYSTKLGKRNRSDYRASILTERFLTTVLKVISNTQFTKVKKLQNIQRFIETINLHSYEKDPVIYAMIVSVKCVVKNKLEGASELEDLIDYVNLELPESFEEIKESMIFPTILAADEASEKEENLVLSTINKFIRYESIFKNKDELSDILTDISSGNISNLDESLQEFEEIISILHNNFEDTKGVGGGLKMFHSSDTLEFQENLKETYNYVNSPKMVLKTGLKRFNRMLSLRDGFLGGCSYIFYADTNTFKSALLRWIVYWIVNYNSQMFMEEFLRTRKRPSLLVVSLEDGSKEDINRYYSIFTKTDLMESDNVESALNMWTESSNNSIIDICHINGGEEGVNFATIDNALRKMDEDGYFPIGVVVDSIDLMSPSAEDIRMRVNDETQLLLNRARYLEKWIADKPFPFITAHQLNRVGNQAIQDAKQNGVVDIAKTLGRNMISGSYDIERRVQWSAFIYTEFSKFDNELYLEIKREKCRYKKDLSMDYMVVKLRDGFFIQDDLNTDFESCRASIIPQDDSFTGGAAEIGSRGASSLGNVVDKPMPDPSINSKLEKPVSSGPMMVSSSSTNEVIVNTMLIPVMYSLLPFAVCAGWTPYLVDDDGSSAEVLVGEDGITYVMNQDYSACTPYNAK